ncbi:hypothetical protein HK104_008434 [Borealophlyctis nickersoniae]|nr:hypothetical protein HK104_008434 [Borealophlyctis nickersoniae]
MIEFKRDGAGVESQGCGGADDGNIHVQPSTARAAEQPEQNVEPKVQQKEEQQQQQPQQQPQPQPAVDSSASALDEMKAEKAHLEHQLAISRSHAKKLEGQVRLLTRKRDALQECVQVLKKDVWREREARFVVEKLMGERVKKMEMEIDFKDNELLDLRRNENTASYSISSNPLRPDDDDDLFLMANLPPIVGRGELSISGDADDDEDDDEDGAADDERSESPVSPLPRHEDEEGYGSEGSVDGHSPSPFQLEGVNRLYQEVVSDVSPSTMAVDLDVLAERFGAGYQECVAVVMEAILKFLEVKGKIGSGDEVVKAFTRYNKLISRFIEEDGGQLSLLKQLELFCSKTASRTQHHIRVLMSLYKVDLVEPATIIEWFDGLTEGPAAKTIRDQARSFVAWVSACDASSSEEDSSEEEEGEEEMEEEEEEVDMDVDSIGDEEAALDGAERSRTPSPLPKKRVSFADVSEVHVCEVQGGGLG